MKLEFIRKLFTSMNLARHSNGRLLLKIVMYLHVVFVVTTTTAQTFEIYVMYNRDLVSQSQQDWNNFVIFTSISAIGLSIAFFCCFLLKLARCYENKLRQILNFYRWWNAILMPIAMLSIIYIKAFLLGLDLFGIVLFTAFLLFKTFIVAQVYCIYAKLESSLLDKWKEFQVRRGSEASTFSHNTNDNPCDLKYTNTSDVSSVNESLKPSKSKDCLNNQSELVEHVNHDVNTDTEMLSISNAAFKAIIINPLSITIDKSKLLGEGQFDAVYKGYLRQRHQPKIPVAAKVVKNSDENATFQLLLQEIKISVGVGKHANIVNFYGITSDDSLKAHFAIVMEYCDGGSLEEFLSSNRHTFINMIQEKGSIIYKDQQLYINLEMHGTHSSMDLVRFAHHIALGMEHLASRKIIHGDLASRNILLTSDLTVKLTDFGMSHKLYNYSSCFNGDMTKQMCLPWRWMAFETLRDLKFSEKSDVWAYGVTLWEIFSLGSFPFEDTVWSSDVLKQIERGMRLTRPAFATLEAYKVMQCCWNIDPNKRPSFSSLVSLFHNPKLFSGEVAVKT